jgi:small GTP-binding protein
MDYQQSEIDDVTLLGFLKEAKWDTLLEVPEIHSICVDLKSKVEAIQGDVDLASAHRIKLVVVGDGAVGKTSLLISFATDKFPVDYVPTVFENYTAQMTLNNETILLHLWDTAGQEDYDRLRPLSYPGTDLLLMCYSTAHKPSLESVLRKWSPEVKFHIPNVPCFLIGTKMDLKEQLIQNPNPDFEIVGTDEGQKMANDVGALKFFEISAKTRAGLNEVFQEAVTHVLSTKKAQNPGPSSVVSASPASTSTSSMPPSSASSGVLKKADKDKKCILQ